MANEVVVQIEMYDDGRIMVGKVPEEVEQGAGAEEQGEPAAGAPQAAAPQGQAKPGMAQMAALMGGGQESTGGEEEAEKDYMQPAKSIDEALAIAKQILTQGNGPSQDEQMAQGFGAGGPTAMSNRRPAY